MGTRKITVLFAEVARLAGFEAGTDGRMNLPATQQTADALTRAGAEILLPWEPGDDYMDVTITGAGPVWGWLAAVHGMHGTARTLRYAAPNCEPLVIWTHGAK